MKSYGGGREVPKIGLAGRYLIPLLAILACCSVPDLDKLDLADCIRDSNARARYCISVAKASYEFYGDAIWYVDATEDCALTLLDDIADCVDAAEQVLSE